MLFTSGVFSFSDPFFRSHESEIEKASPYEHIGEGLFRYVPTGNYHARIQVNLKDIRNSLRTTDPAPA